jgi:hypothetical protein
VAASGGKIKRNPDTGAAVTMMINVKSTANTRNLGAAVDSQEFAAAKRHLQAGLLDECKHMTLESLREYARNNT